MKKIFKSICLVTILSIFLISLTGCGKKGAYVVDDENFEKESEIFDRVYEQQ